jgi:hypothetical protein
MGAKACISVGVILFLLGIAIILIGTVGIEYELPRLKTDYLVIDSTSSQQYSNWAGGYDKQVEFDMVFYFYNLTNPDPVRQTAAIPNYTLLGPYVYRRYRTSINVSFPDGGNQIKYADFREYQFVQASSAGTKDDYIVNMNPVFLSALGQAGTEWQMLGGAVGGYFPNFTAYFTGDFISLYTSFVLPEYLHNATVAQISLINETLHNTTSSTEYFLSVWCNATSAVNITIGSNWNGLLLSEYLGKPTNISKESAKMLLDPTIPLSLLNTENITSWAWDRSLTNTSYSSMLMKAFNLTTAQLQAIWYWRVKSFGPKFIYPSAIAKYNLNNISDIGWVQWTAGYDILGGTLDAPISIHDLYPTEEIGYYTTVELFSILTVPPPFPNWRTTKQVMNPTTGLGNMTIFQVFALIMSYQDPNTNYSQWGTTEDQAQQLYSFVFSAGIQQVAPALIAVYGDSGGLVLRQTVDDWVLNCNYFLINLLLPVPQPCSLLLNNSLFSTATIWNGKNNISNINQYVEWNGSPIVSGVWAQDIPVKGCTELGQFVPDQDKNTVLQTFNDEFVRTMTLRYNSSTSIQDISVNQFVLDYNDTFSVNPLYFQTIPGFANLTSLKQAPMYYSLWDMLYVNESYRRSIIGTNFSSTEADCITILYVEPITGNALKLETRLQANIFTPPDCGWCANTLSSFDNFAFPQNTFFPLVKAGEFTEITSDLASQIRLKINALKYGPKYGMMVGLPVGIVVVGVGIASLGYGVKKYREYSNIPDYHPLVNRK